VFREKERERAEMKETASARRKRGEESPSASTATDNGNAGVSEKGEESKRHRSVFKKVARATLFTVRATSLQWKTIRGVPIRRRVQTLCVLLWLLGLAILPLLMWPLAFFAVFFTPLSPLVIGYLTWVFFFDDSAQTGKRSRPISRFRIWKQVRDYFPIRMIKTVEIESNRSYVFGYHPHGVISMGALVNFGTFASDFDKMYPGVNVHLLTLAGNFYMPVLREWILWMGLCDASRETCHNILTKGEGESILLAVGGAEESLDAFPGKYKLTLKNRKGFVRVALKAGASLVPVISFGENELWGALPNPTGSKLRSFQEGMKKILKFTFPIIHGRGIFNYNFGLMPFRRPIHTVVGAPILVDSPCDVETEEGRKKVDQFHALYIQRLKDLFNEHRAEYAKGLELEIK